MKKLLLFAIIAMAIPAFIACSSDDDKKDDSPYIEFKDANFKEFCMEFDLDGDGNISKQEVSNVEEIICRDQPIKSLDEIKYFTSLKYLDCWRNDLTSLDVSKNIALEVLLCEANNLTYINLSKNTALTDLDCGKNNLTSLDISKNTALKKLTCAGNQLTTLDVSKNTKLEELWCIYNPNLTELWLANGQTIPNLNKDSHTVIKYK